MSTSTPWAVLLCMFADKNDATLFEPVLTINNLFTSTGDGLFNVTRYFRENSHGTLDLTGSQVFGPFVVPGTKAGAIAGAAARDAAMDAARKAALDNGVPLANFKFVCVIFNDAIGGNQGSTAWGTIPPLPGVITDYRFALNNGTGDFGHEMAHAYGLGHGRLGAVDEPEGEDWDYQDPWDITSYASTLTAPDPDFGQRGPGVNAWNMRSRGWLDESRIWKPSGTRFDQTVQLRPLHRRDLAGWLAAELPPNDGLRGHGRYLVEYRAKEGWDAQFPRSAVFVHSFSTAHSYLLTGVQRGALWLLSQGSPNGGFGGWQPVGATAGLGETTIGHNADGRLEVFALDATEGSAWHVWQGTPNGAFGGWEIMGDARRLCRISVANNADGRLELFAIDNAAGLAWHKWQGTPNGAFSGWEVMGDARRLCRISVANNADGRLELFAVDNVAGLAWHNWQVTPNGGWHGWRRLGDAQRLGEIVTGRNADGRLEVFALDAQEGSAWHVWQDVPNAAFGSWEIMDDARGFSRLAVANSANGRIEVFATDKTAGLARHNWQVAPNGGWDGWQRLGDAVGLGDLAVGRNADGRLDLFAIDNQLQISGKLVVSGKVQIAEPEAAGIWSFRKLVWRATQTSANGAFDPWGIAVDARGGFGHIAVAAQTNGALDLIAVDTVGHADVGAGETLNLGVNGGPNVQVQVVKIDDANRTAMVRLISHV